MGSWRSTRRVLWAATAPYPMKVTGSVPLRPSSLMAAQVPATGPGGTLVSSIRSARRVRDRNERANQSSIIGASRPSAGVDPDGRHGCKLARELQHSADATEECPWPR